MSFALPMSHRATTCEVSRATAQVCTPSPVCCPTWSWTGQMPPGSIGCTTSPSPHAFGEESDAQLAEPAVGLGVARVLAVGLLVTENRGPQELVLPPRKLEDVF